MNAIQMNFPVAGGTSGVPTELTGSLAYFLAPRQTNGLPSGTFRNKRQPPLWVDTAGVCVLVENPKPASKRFKPFILPFILFTMFVSFSICFVLYMFQLRTESCSRRRFPYERTKVTATAGGVLISACCILGKSVRD